MKFPSATIVNTSTKRSLLGVSATTSPTFESRSTRHRLDIGRTNGRKTSPRQCARARRWRLQRLDATGSRLVFVGRRRPRRRYSRGRRLSVQRRRGTGSPRGVGRRDPMSSRRHGRLRGVDDGYADPTGRFTRRSEATPVVRGAPSLRVE